MPKEKDPEIVQIGERIREFGSKRYRTMTEFAEDMGMVKESLSQYLTGKVAPGYNYLKDCPSKDVIYIGF